MIRRTTPSPKSEFEGEPFSIIIEGKNRKTLTLLIITNYITWLGGSFFLISFGFIEHSLMIAFTFAGIMMTGQKTFHLLGSDDTWTITRYLSYYLFVFRYQHNTIQEPHFELRVVSHRRKDYALLTLIDSQTKLDLRIKINNIHAKDLVETIQNIKLSIVIRKRGKQRHIS